MEATARQSLFGTARDGQYVEIFRNSQALVGHLFTVDLSSSQDSVGTLSVLVQDSDDGLTWAEATAQPSVSVPPGGAKSFTVDAVKDYVRVLALATGGQAHFLGSMARPLSDVASARVEQVELACATSTEVTGY